MDDGLPAGGQPLADSRWQPWPPAELARRLASTQVPWYVAGGWALDLHREQVTREHDDIEIAVPAAGFPAVRQALGDLEFLVAGDGRLWPLESPAYQSQHQTWGRERATGIWRVDVFREPHQGGTWICRRHPAGLPRLPAPGYPLAPQPPRPRKPRRRPCGHRADSHRGECILQ